jgi:glycogen operon protein
MMALGVPMILMGDEMRQTQGGNNNAYCQDNEISWLDWSLLKKHDDVHRFVSLLNEKRLLRDVEHERRRTSLTALLAKANKAWHGVKPNQPDWGDGSRSIAFCAEMKNEGLYFYLILNAYWEALEFELAPPGDGGHLPWRRWIDTGLDSPDDIVPWKVAPPVEGSTYRVESRSVVMLFANGGVSG